MRTALGIGVQKDDHVCFGLRFRRGLSSGLIGSLPSAMLKLRFGDNFLLIFRISKLYITFLF